MDLDLKNRSSVYSECINTSLDFFTEQQRILPLNREMEKSYATRVTIVTSIRDKRKSVDKNLPI